MDSLISLAFIPSALRETAMRIATARAADCTRGLETRSSSSIGTGASDHDGARRNLLNRSPIQHNADAWIVGHRHLTGRYDRWILHQRGKWIRARVFRYIFHTFYARE